MSDRSYDVSDMEKALKYELRSCEVEAMNKIVKDMDDAARRHNSKILYRHVSKLRGSSQSRLVPAKDRHKTRISDKERVKQIWPDHYENF